jgi:hypothetical protein
MFGAMICNPLDISDAGRVLISGMWKVPLSRLRITCPKCHAAIGSHHALAAHSAFLSGPPMELLPNSER